MREAIVVALMIMALSLLTVETVQADDLVDLKEQVQALQRQMQEQATQIERQHQLIADLQRQDTFSQTQTARAATPPGQAGGEADKPSTHWPDLAEVGYRKGLYLKTQDDQYALHFRFLLQPQYEWLDADGSEDTNTARIRRGQLRLFGNVLNPQLKYKMMIEGRSTAAGGATMELKDLWMDWEWAENTHLQAGQFLVYYDYEDIQPTWALPLVDRSIINANLGFERDLGIRLHGKALSERLHYDLYAMNGDGRNTLNANDDMIYGTRLNYQLLGSQQFQLPDLENSEDPHLALGTAFLHDSGSASLGDDTINRFTSDLAFRYRGWSALGLVNLARNEKRGATDFGVLGQVGYFVIPERLELAGRWAKIYRDAALVAVTSDAQEMTLGVNYYVNKHQIKLQTDYSRLWNNASTPGRDDNRVRVQAQLFF